MPHHTPHHFDLVAEIVRLRNRLTALEQTKAGFGTTGIIHIGEIDTENVPVTGPDAGGGFLYVQGGALKYIGPTDNPQQIGAP